MIVSYHAYKKVILCLIMLSICPSVLRMQHDQVLSNLSHKNYSVTEQILIVEVALKISEFKSLWQYCRSTGMPNDAVRCENSKNISVMNCYCLTADKSENQAELGKCFYNCGNSGKSDPLYTTLPNTTQDLDDFMCGKYFNMARPTGGNMCWLHFYHSPSSTWWCFFSKSMSLPRIFMALSSTAKE